MNENTTPQISGSQPNPTEIGIPSVAGKKSSPAKNRNLALMAALVVLMLICIAFGFYQKHSSRNAQPKQQEQATPILSGRTLTLPPLSQIQPPEAPPAPVVIKEPAEPKPEKEAGLIQEPPAIQTQQAASSPMVNSTKEKPEPTLAEKRNMAPMMGEWRTLRERRKVGKRDLRPPSVKGYDSGSGRNSGGKLGGLLSSVSTPPTSAAMMPDRNLLLPKGTFIDCVLETKLDTTVPGMTSCVIPRDVYSANGRVLLIERGSKAIGEYKGAVENGLNRIFVLWTQIQTPKGVRVNIDSPATDALGGSGMAGEIDFHWWARFGNALLFTLIQDGFDFAMTKQTENNGGVNYYQNSEDGMNQIIQEAMRQSGNIPPTLTKNQGERVGIFVARDVDFSKVYQLKPISR
ncbi:MAG: type IV secretion system protein VirB10 [Parasutterella excrementihominis]